MAGSGVQDICSIQPKFRNAHLLLSHVLDWCVKLLAVLHISSAQGQSVDLSMEIATGRRSMIDIKRNMANNIILMKLQRLPIAPVA